MIAIFEENDRLFPDRPVNEGKVSVSTGLMNILSAGVGGVPMCPGAGGLVLLLTARLFSGSVITFLRLFPPAILGVILFLTGAQLALGACDIPKDKDERVALIITGAPAV
jgi:hypothetical protein